MDAIERREYAGKKAKVAILQDVYVVTNHGLYVIEKCLAISDQAQNLHSFIAIRYFSRVEEVENREKTSTDEKHLKPYPLSTILKDLS